MRYAGPVVRPHEKLVNLHIRVPAGAENHVAVIHDALAVKPVLQNAIVPAYPVNHRV
jgi:hypothetical protein